MTTKTTWVRKFHRCDDCSTALGRPVEWEDEWHCACDDACLECGAAIEAHDWEHIDHCEEAEKSARAAVFAGSHPGLFPAR